MRFFRRCLADRLAGGVLAAFMAYMLVLSALLGSMTCSLAAGAGAAFDADFVICSASGASTQPGAPAHNGSHCHCPCGLVCSAGGAVLAAVPPAAVVAPAIARTVVAHFPVESQVPLKPALLHRLAEARAPPVFSV